MNRVASALGIRILRNAGVVHLRHIRAQLERSPLVLFGAFHYPNRRTPLNHAVVMYSMWGDGTDSTAIQIVDPQYTELGDNPEKDTVVSWREFGTSIIDRLDYISALRS